MIYLIPLSGLCNRLRAIASAIALARDSGAMLKIYWVKNHDLNCRFDDLFSPMSIDNVELIECNRKPILFRAYRSDNKWKGAICTIIEGIQKRFIDQILYKKDPVNLFLHENGSLENPNRIIIETQHRFYRCENFNLYFKPILQIQDRIDKQVASFAPHTIGVHLRRTDLPQQHLSPTSSFIKMMEEEVKKDNAVSFFVASDSETDKQELQEKFGGRVITTIVETSRSTLEGMQDAVFDLFVLARTNMILGTYYSSFSETAAIDIGQLPYVSVGAEIK